MHPATRRVGGALLAALLLVAGLLLHPPVRLAAKEPPGNSTEAVKRDITAVVEDQLAAFRAGDWERAYSHAATPIREMFPLADFRRMVSTGYPLIAKSASADFGICLDNGSDAVVYVRVDDGAGRAGDYQYTLTKEKGAWRITGVSAASEKGSSV